MKFFLDTADIEEIRRARALGLLDGVTTNPSLIAKEGRNFWEVVKDICQTVQGPVSVEVVGLNATEMIEEGKRFAKVHKNVVVKVPLIEEGIQACRELVSQGIRVNVTLCFSPSQALIAAKAGATYVSPFIGRLDDISQNGMDLVRDIRTIYQNYGFKTEILVASIRHPLHVVEAAKAGAHVATMPYKVFNQLFQHPQTDLGLERFLADWNKVKDKIFPEQISCL
ncbi:MAG: fructose-6-phosphate aldolase [Candidatus Omnitrophica bacterium]|nr:fructose-6-phosphate aldolase [Candidatus Omnitrophota bacterium]